jgi:hypothetical protein
MDSSQSFNQPIGRGDDHGRKRREDDAVPSNSKKRPAERYVVDKFKAVSTPAREEYQDVSEVKG